MTSINGANHMASLALRGLDKSSDVMLEAMDRLSSGKRINRSADDAAGMAIKTVHKAQTMGLGGAVKHASDAIIVVNSIDGSLSSANNLLLKMRELAVQGSSGIYTKEERKFMNDEVNQINTALNRLATDTVYNNKKLLDGTYNAKITIGKDAQEFVNLSINSMDTSSIGSHEINSNVEITSLKNDHNIAKNNLNAQFNSNADYDVKGANGSATITINGGENAREVAQRLNLVTGKTGVSASVITKAKIVSIDASDHFTFTLEGKNSNASVVNATINDNKNLTALKDSINSVSTKTGIFAELTNNNSSIILTQVEGYNIVIGDLTSSSSNMVIDAMKKSNLGIFEDNNSTITLEGASNSSDSAAILGQLTLSSSKAFSVASGHVDNHFSASTSDVSSNFISLSEINLSSEQSSSNAIERIDSALAMISEMRSEMGAKSVRFQSIVSNLTNVELNTDRHLDFLEDAEFTTETSKLATSQVIQKASTAMIAQANNVNNFMMSFLNQFK